MQLCDLLHGAVENSPWPGKIQSLEIELGEAGGKRQETGNWCHLISWNKWSLLSPQSSPPAAPPRGLSHPTPHLAPRSHHYAAVCFHSPLPLRCTLHHSSSKLHVTLWVTTGKEVTPRFEAQWCPAVSAKEGPLWRQRQVSRCKGGLRHVKKCLWWTLHWLFWHSKIHDLLVAWMCIAPGSGFEPIHAVVLLD